MMNIIVTDTHTRMALAVVRELGLAGYHVTSVTRLSKPSLGHSSRFAAARITLPDEGYADALLKLGSSGNKPVLLATGMQTLQAVALRFNEFQSTFRMLIPSSEALEAAGDKLTVMHTARELGLLTPKAYSEDAPKFPCVIKFRNGEALQLHANERYAIIHNKKNYDTTLKAMSEKGEVFVSQYIQGNAYGVSAVLNDKSEPLAVFCHTRVREYPLSGGPACCAEAIWNDKLVDAALRLLKAMRLTGFAMVEFKGMLEQPYILEINPRIWGTYPLSRQCGAGMSVTYARALLEDDMTINRGCNYKTGVRIQYLANDVMHAVSSLQKGAGVKASVIGDFFSPRVKGGVFDWHDMPGTLAYAKTLLKKR